MTPSGDAISASRRPRLEVRYDGYVDPRRSNLSAAVSLESGAFAVPVRVAWDPLDRRLTAVPVDPLRPGLSYVWAVDETAIVGLGGAASAPIGPVVVRIAADATEPPPSGSRVVTYGDIEPLLEAHCGCHSGPEPGPLDFDGLRRRAAAFPDRSLVDPYDAASSYLVEKILPGYADRFGTEMPPPWSDGPALDYGARRRIIEWIDDGATR